MSKVDVHEAFDVLSRHIGESRHALVRLALFTVDQACAAGTIRVEEAADRFEAMAQEAGETFARASGVAFQPNPVLQQVADLLRGASTPWQVLQGGLSDDGHEDS